MTPHRRPSRGGDTEPRAANEEAGREHGKRRPLIFPERGGANGERADNQRIGQQKRVVARPERFPIRIDEVDIGLEHGELFGLRRRSLFIRGHWSNSSLAAGQPPDAVPARGKGGRLAALVARKNPKDLPLVHSDRTEVVRGCNLCLNIRQLQEASEIALGTARTASPGRRCAKAGGAPVYSRGLGRGAA